jgi:hypothetical protein
MRIVTFTTLVSSLTLAPVSHADTPDICGSPDVKPSRKKGKEIGGWLDVLAVISPSTDANSEYAASMEVCGARNDCEQESLVYCDANLPASCYVRKDDNSAFHRFADLFGEAEMENVKFKGTRLGDSRFLHLGLSQELTGRVADANCEPNEEGELECTSAFGTIGWRWADVVIDLDTMRLVWVARYGLDDERGAGDAKCEGANKVSLKGDRFTRTSCDGKIERFELADLEQCE